MILRHQRRLFGCAIATALVFGVSGVPTFAKDEKKTAAKPADKHRCEAGQAG